MRVAEMHLGVHNDLVAFQQDKIAVWYYCLSVALDHNDKRLPRNTKLFYLSACPAVVFTKMNFYKRRIRSYTSIGSTGQRIPPK